MSPRLAISPVTANLHAPNGGLSPLFGRYQCRESAPSIAERRSLPKGLRPALDNADLIKDSIRDLGGGLMLPSAYDPPTSLG